MDLVHVANNCTGGMFVRTKLNEFYQRTKEIFCNKLMIKYIKSEKHKKATKYNHQFNHLNILNMKKKHNKQMVLKNFISMDSMDKI